MNSPSKTTWTCTGAHRRSSRMIIMRHFCEASSDSSCGNVPRDSCFYMSGIFPPEAAKLQRGATEYEETRSAGSTHGHFNHSAQSWRKHQIHWVSDVVKSPAKANGRLQQSQIIESRRFELRNAICGATKRESGSKTTALGDTSPAQAAEPHISFSSTSLVSGKPEQNAKTPMFS